MTAKASSIICVLLLVYFIFTSGMVFEMTHSAMDGTIDLPYSLALSSKRLNMVGVFNENDVACAKWLVDNKEDVPLVADYNGYALFIGCQYRLNQYYVPTKDDDGYYLYLSSWNTEHQMMVVGSAPGLRQYLPLPKLDKAVVVFKKGDAGVYYVEND